jgi:hypothetical protein
VVVKVLLAHDPPDHTRRTARGRKDGMVKDLQPHPYELYFLLTMENHLRKRACVVLSIHSQSKRVKYTLIPALGVASPRTGTNSRRQSERRHQMRDIILAAAIFCSSASIAFAEVPVTPRPPAGSLAVEQTSQNAHETAIADCERMWDRGTHMSKREWSQTCRRVQNRLQQIELR